MLTALKAFNLALAFMLELAMFASIVFWGFYRDQSWLIKLLLGILLPAVVIVVWALWFSPNSTQRFEALPGLLISLVMFLIAALLLAQAGQGKIAILFVVVAVMNRVLAWMWKQW
jgi:hypothetical protein